MRNLIPAFLAALSLAGCVSVPQGTPVNVTPAMRASIEQGTRQALKDPMSAMFGTIRAARFPDGRLFVCGYVNAKNSFGGYVGEKPFTGYLYPGGHFQFTSLASSEGEMMGARYVCQQAGIPI